MMTVIDNMCIGGSNSKPLLIACTVLLIAGNVVYTLTDSEYTRFFMIIGRALWYPISHLQPIIALTIANCGLL
jgi:hypothetical protein